jgi:hypothetical protein
MDSASNPQSLKNGSALDFSTDIGDGAAKTLETLRQFLQKIPADLDPAICAAQESEILRIYDTFYQYAMKWAGENRRKHASQPTAPEAVKFKKRAAEVMSDLQLRMKVFGLCSLRLQRAGVVLQNHIRKYLDDNPEITKAERIKWTSDTGVLLGRYRKERSEIITQLGKLSEGLLVLNEAEKNLIAFQSAAQKLFGADKAEEYIRSFRAALRVADFPKARKIIDSLHAAGSSVQAPAKAYLDALEQSAACLTGAEGKLFLNTNEVQLVVMTKEQDIKQKKAFIEKYRLSAMENKLAGLSHLKDKLQVIGSFDSLMTLFIKLMRGLALPLPDSKTVREFETNVLEKITYLLGSQFQEIDIIEKRNQELLSEFFADQADYQKGA